jgi:hypothetical protein
MQDQYLYSTVFKNQPAAIYVVSSEAEDHVKSLIETVKYLDGHRSCFIEMIIKRVLNYA